MKTTDVLIIGSGIAGASAALKLAQNPQRRIILLTREPDPHELNSRYAQGGIIGRGLDDSPDLLVEDILAAGAGASLPEAAHILAEEGPGLLEEVLVKTAGIAFDLGSNGEPDWGQEAAHSRRRILHIGDGTGRAIMDGLVRTLKGLPNVDLETNATAVDLITYPHHSRDPLSAYQPVACHGAYIFDRAGRTVHRTLASATILATGGLGRIFRNTTNPAGARGDGLAMASRAGARITNAEYIQFHPTALSVPGAEGFLISEAVRGEGGVLLTPDGQRFMEKYSPEWKDLAPRRGGTRHTHGNGNKRLFICATGYCFTHASRGDQETFPQHPCRMPAGRVGYHARTDPGGAGCTLLLRRCFGGRMGTQQHPEPVRSR